MPRSPRKAPAICCSTVAWLAFQPKRPRPISPAIASQTRLGRPEIPSPSASSGSACGEDRPRGSPRAGRSRSPVAQSRRDHRVLAEWAVRGRRSRRSAWQRVGRAVAVLPSMGVTCFDGSLGGQHRGSACPAAGRRKSGDRPGPGRRARRARTRSGAARGRPRLLLGSAAPASVQDVARRAGLAVEHRTEAVAGPSRPGRVTQFWLKKLSPTSKRVARRRSGSGRTAERRASGLCRVVSPPRSRIERGRRRPRHRTPWQDHDESGRSDVNGSAATQPLRRSSMAFASIVE